mmetsp:Transcript_110572/g.312668  ORF Transcript_110572/g.312668 Transcript_110572/m.312668 type:complete len:337 (-) Transcript_110572:121-1131(-)
MFCQRIISVVGVLASSYCALSHELAQRGLGDDMSLLQAELEKAKDMFPGSPAGDAKAPRVKESFCRQLAADAHGNSDEVCDQAESKPWETVPASQGDEGAALQEPADSPLYQKTSKDASPASTTTLAGATLGYILDAIVCILVLDGLRRWWQRRGATTQSEGWDGLMQAALAGDTKRCEALLDNATSIIGSDLWGCTVLHAASKGGSVSVVKRLLEHGALVDEPDSWDETPLHLAARAGHVSVCELLLAHGAPVDAVNAQDWTPLIVAAEAGHGDVCNLLLARGASVAGHSPETLPPLLVCLLHANAPEDNGQAEEPLKEEEFWQEEELEDFSEAS